MTTLGRTLHIACQESDLDYLKFLLTSCVERKHNVNDQDYNGDTCLHIACRSNNVPENLNIVKLLLEHNADIHIPNKGGITSLRYICTNIRNRNCFDIYNLFIEKYKNIDISKYSNSEYLLSSISLIRKWVTENLKTERIMNEIRDLGESLYHIFRLKDRHHQIININSEFVDDLILELSTYGYTIVKNDITQQQENKDIIYYQFSAVGNSSLKKVLQFNTCINKQSIIDTKSLSNFNYKFENDINLEIIKLIPEYIHKLDKNQITLDIIYYRYKTRKITPSNMFNNNSCISSIQINDFLAESTDLQTFIKKYNHHIIKENIDSKKYAFLNDIIQTEEIIIDYRKRCGTYNVNGNAYVIEKYWHLLEGYDDFRNNSIIRGEIRNEPYLITDYFLSKIYKRAQDKYLFLLPAKKMFTSNIIYSTITLLIAHLIDKKYLSISDIKEQDLLELQKNQKYKLDIMRFITKTNFTDDEYDNLLKYDKINDIIYGNAPLKGIFDFYLQYGNYISIIKDKLIVKVLATSPLYYGDFLDMLATEYVAKVDQVSKDKKYEDLLNNLVNMVPDLILKCDIKSVTTFSNKNIKALYKANKLTLDAAHHIGKYNGKILKYVEDPTLCDIALATNYKCFIYIKKQLKHNIEYVLNIDGLLLRYVRKQNEDYCLIAVKQNKKACIYINKMLLNDDFIVKLVNNNGLVLKYVKNQTTSLCIIAILNNPKSIKYVKKQTPDICNMVLNNYPQMIIYLRNFI